MADAYVDADGYRRRTGNQATGTDSMLNEVLLTACRLLDRELGYAPGHLGPVTSTTYRFDGHGGTLLRLRDNVGRQYLLRSITADSLALDTDADGSFDDYLWDLADAWVRGVPENALTFDEAYTGLELMAHLSTAPLSEWPNQRDSIRITGTWGMPIVPGAIQELVVDIARNLRQRQLAGGISLPGPDEALPLSASMWPVLRRARDEYSRRIPI